MFCLLKAANNWRTQKNSNNEREQNNEKDYNKNFTRRKYMGIEEIKVLYLDNTTTTTFKYLKTINAHIN
jgi:hypothetical protein